LGDVVLRVIIRRKDLLRSDKIIAVHEVFLVLVEVNAKVRFSVDHDKDNGSVNDAINRLRLIDSGIELGSLAFRDSFVRKALSMRSSHKGKQPIALAMFSDQAVKSYDGITLPLS
jgi:hypothetical protein